MDESEQRQQKNGLSKKTIAIVIGLLLIIGGTVSAFLLLDKTSKEKYFLAEKETIEVLGSNFDEKYKLESEWVEKVSENPNKAEHRVNLGVDSAAMGGDSFGMVDPFEMISNVTFMLDVESNTDEKEIAVDLGVDFANLDLGNVGVSISGHDLFVELPFTEDIMHIEDQELSALLYELDPYTFSEAEQIDFDSFFEAFTTDVITEKDMEYLQEEYGEFLYEKLPESAFSEEKESITVHGEKLKTDKVTMHLTEDEVKELLEDFLTKLENDEKVNEILENIFELQFTTGGSLANDQTQLMNELMSEFEEGIAFAKDNIDQIHIPDGITSIIWIDKNKVAQRDFSLTVGPDADNLESIAIEGTHLLEEDKQQFDFDLIVDDSFEEFVLNVEGDLNWDNNQGNDTVTFRAEDVEITYEASEELTDKTTKEFVRSLHYTDELDDFELTWSGDATYESEKMKSSHTLAFVEGGLAEEMTLNIDKKGSIIKNVTIPAKADAVLLGEMEMFEIDMYVEQLTSEFEQWIQQLMGGGMFGF